MSERIDTADAAKTLRGHLKEVFPSVTFSVKISRYSGGSSVNIHWTDGPTDAQVKEISEGYRGASFDGMIDLKSYHDSYADSQGRPCSASTPGARKIHFGPDYVFTDRRFSKGFLEGVAALVCAEYGCPEPEIVDSYDGKHGEVKENYHASPYDGARYSIAETVQIAAQETEG